MISFANSNNCFTFAKQNNQTLNIQTMNTTNLTANEVAMLTRIIGQYNEDCNLCFTAELNQSEKGIIGSLVKKGLIYDSFDDEYLKEIDSAYDTYNFFPTDEAIELINEGAL